MNNQNSAFTLVEVMASVSIALGVIFFVGNFFIQSARDTKESREDQEHMMVMEQLVVHTRQVLSAFKILPISEVISQFESSRTTEYHDFSVWRWIPAEEYHKKEEFRIDMKVEFSTRKKARLFYEPQEGFKKFKLPYFDIKEDFFL